MNEPFSLDSWLESGTTATEQVTLYADRALAGEFTALERRLAALEQATGGGDDPLDGAGEAESIHAQMEDLYRRWEASKAVWTVRALADEEVEAIWASHPVPKAPAAPPDDAPAEAKRAHQGALDLHLRTVKHLVTERNLAYIAAAVTRVETSGGAVDAVTVDQLRKMRSRPHGAQDVTRLLEAVNRVTQGDVEVPRPTLPGSSRSGRA